MSSVLTDLVFIGFTFLSSFFVYVELAVLTSLFLQNPFLSSILTDKIASELHNCPFLLTEHFILCCKDSAISISPSSVWSYKSSLLSKET